MADVAELGYGTVRGKFLAGILDTADAGVAPDGVPMTGYVEFSATAPAIRVVESEPVPATVFPVAVKVNLDAEGRLVHNGSNDISLWATDDPDGNPVNWQWRVSFYLQYLGNDVPYDSFNFALPAGEEVDLTVVAPLTSPSPGVVIIRGPKGDPGDPGSGEGGGGEGVWGSITGTLADQDDLVEALADKADAESVAEALADKASIEELDTLATTVEGKASTQDLTTGLGTKASTNHSHTSVQITDLNTALDAHAASHAPARVLVVTGEEARPNTTSYVDWIDPREDPTEPDNFDAELMDAWWTRPGNYTPPAPPAPPIITTTSIPSMTIGSAYSTVIAANPAAESWSATGLPAGLTINAGNGTISGIPTTLGTGTTTVTATNDDGADTATFAWTVAEDAPDPEPGEVASIFGESAPPGVYNIYNDGGNAGNPLRVATAFYRTDDSFRVEGARFWLPSGLDYGAGDLHMFYGVGFTTIQGGSPLPGPAAPGWNEFANLPAGQQVVIPVEDLAIGWNEVTFDSNEVIAGITGSPGVTGYVNGTWVWVGYWFEGGAHYIHTPEVVNAPAVESVALDNLYQAEGNFGNPPLVMSRRSANSVPAPTTALYGIDILASDV